MVQRNFSCKQYLYRVEKVKKIKSIVAQRQPQNFKGLSKDFAVCILRHNQKPQFIYRGVAVPLCTICTCKKKKDGMKHYYFVVHMRVHMPNACIIHSYTLQNNKMFPHSSLDNIFFYIKVRKLFKNKDHSTRASTQWCGSYHACNQRSVLEKVSKSNARTIFSYWTVHQDIF